jgi:transcriptional regulator with XRE-family HTH domain
METHLRECLGAVGERLKEERLRLGMKQLEFAAAGGVGKNAQINYESGERQPDSHYLQAIAAVGVDCQYILTGVRSLNLRDVQRASRDDFLNPPKPQVTLQKDIDGGLLTSLLADVLRVAESYSGLREVTPTDIAGAVVKAYLERTGSEQSHTEAALFAAIEKRS